MIKTYKTIHNVINDVVLDTNNEDIILLDGGGEIALDDGSGSSKSDTDSTDNTDNGDFSFKDGEYYDGDKIVVDKSYLEENSITLNEDGDQIDADGIVTKTKAEVITELIKVKKEDSDGKSTDTDLNLDIDISYTSEKGYVKKDGTSVFSKEELTDTKFDTEGNQIDDEGKIIKTKEQIIKEYGDETTETAKVAEEAKKKGTVNDKDLNQVQKIAKRSGIQVKDERGAIVEFENSIDGIAARELAISKQYENRGRQGEIERFFKTNPDIHEAMLYKQTHNGSLEGFNDFVDYNKVTIDKDNKEQQRNIIIQGELAKGNTPERAGWTATKLNDEGKTLEAATETLKHLQTNQQNKIQEGLAKAEEANLAVKTEHDEHVKAVQIIINSGKLKLSDDVELNIPGIIRRTINGKIIEASRENFIVYYTFPQYVDKRTGEQLTADDVESMQAPVQSDIWQALKQFAGGESQFTAETIAEEKVKSLGNIFKTIKSTPKSRIFKTAKDISKDTTKIVFST